LVPRVYIELAVRGLGKDRVDAKRSGNLVDLLIEKVEQDSKGDSLVIRLTQDDAGSHRIKIGVDELTAKNIRKIMETGYFDNLARDQHEYRVKWWSSIGSKGDPNRKFFAEIECRYRHAQKEVKVPCTEFFAQNIQWFHQEFRHIDQVKHLLI
jgi:hypothetical protein